MNSVDSAIRLLPRRTWDLGQWATYLRDQEVPVLPSTRDALRKLLESHRETIAPRRLAGLVLADPYLALKLLRRVESRRSTRLGRETTTPLASVLHAGVDELQEVILTGSSVEAVSPGLLECHRGASIASSLARDWATMRADVSPGELAMAALLAETGELLLWHFAPELPGQVCEEMESGRASGVVEAQHRVCGFSFKEMTIALAESMQLPKLITLLIHGTGTLRANLARVASETARHIAANPEHPEIVGDILRVRELLPRASLRLLLAPLPVSGEYKEYVMAQVVKH